MDSSLLIPLNQPTGGVVTRGHSFKLQKRDSKISVRANVLTSTALICVTVLISRTCSGRDDDDVSMKISRQATSLWKTEDDDDDAMGGGEGAIPAS